MSPSTPNRPFSNKVSGPEIDHRHIDRTVEVRSRLPDTLLIAVNEQLCSNSNPGRSAALKRGHAEYGGGHEVAGRITIEIEGDASTVIAVIAFLAMAGAWVSPHIRLPLAGPDLPGPSSAQAGGIGAVRSWRRLLVAGAPARREVT